MPRRLQLESPTLGELTSRVMAQYGPHAAIVAVDEVTAGGIGGFFATRRFVATVEIPDPPLDTRPIDSHQLDLPARVGIAALLDDADAAEVHVNGARQDVSTSSREFADILSDLVAVTDATGPAPTGAVPSAPLPLGHAGDLVVVAGLDGDALPVARMMAKSAAIAVAGELAIPDAIRVENRQAAIAARANGVRASRPIFVAIGMGHGAASVGVHAEMIELLRADQVWAVVDASRKPGDTAGWMRELEAVVAIDAVAGVRRRSTETPETVQALNLPVSWAFDAWIG